MSKSSSAPMLQRPLYGGVFGDGQYSLATMPTVANGLHAVRFLVVDPRGGAVLSVGETKTEVIASARRLLRGSVETVAANDETWEQGELWPGERAAAVALAPPPGRVVSRRRRAVFEKSEGRCHYCAAALTLDGKWHIEHMRPRAIGGTDDPRNLVAACTRCNLAKGDRTALEFVARGPGSND